ncbi:MAG: ATP-binding protein [Desulfatirhabdiaceae bacterium]|nr:ATP-binding protein [Desulfatirhabdiaceae bacterium]
MTINILSILLVLIGAAVLFLSISPAIKICRNLIDRVRRKWIIILYLMGFFIFGYLSFDIILICNLPFPLELVTGGVFLGGAVFVFIVMNVSLGTITALQKAEEAIHVAKDDWESTFDAVTDMITVHDMDFNIIRANPAARAIFELQQHKGISLGKCFRCYHGTETPPSGCVSCQSLQTGKPSAFEAFEPHLNKHLEIRAMPRFGNDSRIVGLIHVVRDITERKQAEEEKDKLQAQLAQAQKMESVGRLAGGVAHDFNNMLSAILGHAQLAMMRYTPSAPIYTNLKAIEDAALRSADLTRQLLAFARKQTVAPKVLNLNDTVADMLKMLLRLIGEGIDVVWMPKAGLWQVKIDPSQVDQLLVNLCVNARDAINGVGKVTIETENIAFDEAYCAVHRSFSCGEYVMIAISDDGCGMSKDVLDHIFEPFFTTKELGKGTGLGLATVYGIVKQNNGFVNVYSAPGKGTTFKLYLPRFVGQAMVATLESPAEMPEGRGETVLLVEDEPVILDMSRAMLEQLGYAVLVAGTPGEGLRQAKAHADEIQLLITDVIMPEMNGRDLAEMIVDIKPGMKCLFISGYTADVIAHHGVLDPGVNFIQKPFSMKNLAAKVREALDNPNV